MSAQRALFRRLRPSFSSMEKEVRVTQNGRKYAIYTLKDGRRFKSKKRAMAASTAAAVTTKRPRKNQTHSVDKSAILDAGLSRCYVGAKVPLCGRVPAGEDLPNWTVERAQALDGTNFLLYRDPFGTAVGSRQSALAQTGQLEVPTSMQTQMLKAITERRRASKAQATPLVLSKRAMQLLEKHRVVTPAGRSFEPTQTTADRLLGVEAVEAARSQESVPNAMVLDLFCGIGGFSLGFAAHGTVVYGIDQCSAAISSYVANRCGDGYAVHTLRSEDAPQFSRVLAEAGIGAGARDSVTPLIVVGGAPCQPFSVAGNRGGGADSRDEFDTMITIALATRAHVILIENVPALMDAEFETYVQPQLSRLKSAGYNVEAVVHRCWNHRVPQHRSRLLLQCVLVDAFEEGSSTSFRPDMTSASRPVMPIDCIKAENFWTGPRPNNYRVDSTILDARKRNYTARCLTGCVMSHRLAPTVMTTSAYGNSFNRLLALPTDVDPTKMSYSDVRTVGIRECLSLQTFPTDFEMYGNLRSQSVCVGNALPPLFAYDVAQAVMTLLKYNRPLLSGAVLASRSDLVDRMRHFDALLTNGSVS